MRRLKLGLAISGLLASPLSYALGLGEISTNSALNQPLNAEIELVSTAPSELQNLTVRLAPDSVFEQVGISRTSVLDKLRFTPTVENGVPVIKVTSSEPIQEPFINFVIEVDWPKGKLLREYTVLLDPPVLGEPGGAVAQAPAVEAAPTPAAGETPAPAEEEGQSPFVSGTPAEPVAAATETVESVPLAETYPVEAEPLAAEAEEKVVEKGGLPVAEVKEVAKEVPAEDVGEGLPPFVDQKAAAGGEAQTAPAETQPVEPVAQVDVETYPVTENEINAEEVEPFDVEGSQLDELPLAETYPVEEEAAPAEATAVEEETVVEAEPADQVRVQRGDTLFSIAKRYSPSLGANIDQVMVGFLRENPRAFINRNMNLLKAGYVLRVPDPQTVAEIDPRKARQEVARQTALWRQYRSKLAEAAVPQQKVAEGAGGQVAGIRAVAGEQEQPAAGLEILTPEGGEKGGAAQGTAEQGTEAGAGGAAAADEKELALLREQLESAKQENSELKSRVAELEALLQAKDRLIQLKDAQLAELQKKLGGAELAAQPSAEEEGGEAAAAGGEAASAPPAGSEAEAEQPSASETAAEAGEAAEQGAPAGEEAAQAPAGLLEKEQQPAEGGEETAAPAAEEQPAGESEVAGAATAEEQPAEEEGAPSLSEDLRKNPNLLMGAGIGALLLAVLAWLVFRRKGKPEEAAATAATGGGAPEPEAAPEQTTAGEAPEEEEVVEAQATELSPEESAAAEGEEKTQTIVLDMDDLQMPEEEGPVTTSAELQPAAEEDEVLSEANVYLAYGLHEQAVDLLKPAVDEHPDRLDYKVKLLEAYHAMKDRDSFVALARDVKEELASRQPGDWQKVAAWGKELAPDDETFAGADLDALAASAVQSVPDTGGDTGFDLDASLTGSAPDQSLAGGPDTVSLAPEESQAEDESDIEIEKDQPEEFRLPDLDELSKSLQIDTADDEGLAALQGSAPDLGGEFSVDEDELTMADVDNELTSMTTGADEMATKLDLAKAYMDMGDDEGAREALEEVVANGNDQQKEEARRLLDQLG